MTVDLDRQLAGVADASPLVNALTNDVTVNDVAQVILHWGGLPVMSDDEREVADMVAGAQALLLNMGTVSEDGEAAMIAAGEAAAEHDVPVVLDPVGVGATPTRDRVAQRLATELDVAAIKGNYGEVTALTGDDADVRGVESVGEYDDVVETAVACAQQYDAVVVASGEVDVVATADAAYEVTAGDRNMATVVGTGCMLGATVATFAGAVEGGSAAPTDDLVAAALAGTVGFGIAGELAAEGEFGGFHGPASYQVAFRDAIAGIRQADWDPASERIEQVLDAA